MDKTSALHNPWRNPDNTATRYHTQDFRQGMIIEDPGDGAAIACRRMDKDKFAVMLHAHHHFRNGTGGVGGWTQLRIDGINFLSFRISNFYDAKNFQQAGNR